MAKLSGFDDMEDSADPEFPHSYENLEDVLPLAEAGAATRPDGPEAAQYALEPEEADSGPELDLLEVRGFYVSSGAGIYDGATRDGEEPRDSYFVDVQDYGTGALKRVWGVVLGDVIRQAKATFELQPGSRVHLIQQGKREVFVDYVNERQEMVIRKSRANGWVALPDRGPLPSQLAHLMAGINVDQMLDRIALRHDMGIDDERLPGWKREQKRILSAFGDDPQTVKAALLRQMSLSGADELALVTKAVELQGYSDADPARKQHEIDTRMHAIRQMDADGRYDFLMESAKPHLVDANRNREAGLAREIVQGIEQVTVMATPRSHPDSPERRAMRSALAQSLEGLSLTQQLDYLGQRREMVLQALAAPLDAPETAMRSPRVSRTEPIDATGLSAEEYQFLLEERFALAEGPEEKALMLAQEIAARKAATSAAQADFDAIDALYQRFSGSGGMDATPYVLGLAAKALGRLVSDRIMPFVTTTFEDLGGVGSWRRRNAEADLGTLRGELAAAKETAGYKDFVGEPGVEAASGAKSAGEMAAAPDFARSEMHPQYPQAQAQAQAQDFASAPGTRAAPRQKGLWKGVVGAAHSLSDRISHMSPEHLIKHGGLDQEWITRMQSGLKDFGHDLKQTVMPEQLRAQIQAMVAAIMAAIRMLFELARELLTGRKAVPAAAGMER